MKTEDSDQEMDEDGSAGHTSGVHAKSRFSSIEALNFKLLRVSISRCQVN